MIKKLKLPLNVSLLFSMGILSLNFLPAHQISVQSVPSPTMAPTPAPTWTYEQKISEARQLLSGMMPNVGTLDIEYTEQRIAKDPTTGLSTVSKKKFKEPEKQIVLAVLNTDTGKLTPLTILKHGADLVVPEGWQITILERPNGIRWNGWNTAYHIESPEHQVVIANVYPDESKTVVAKKVKGKTTYVTTQTVDYHFYVPYSPDIHANELIASGASYIDTLGTEAIADLRDRGVQSIAMPGSTVADVWSSKRDFFERIPFLEQTDLTEFIIDPQATIDRIRVIIGANGDQAYAATCNSSSACGWLQFTPTTYAQLVKMYPKASLIKDFKAGAADHLNSLKAAILLYDENLKGLIKSNGTKILQDENLEEYLAASYNGAPSRATKSLAASILNGIRDWIDALSGKKGGLASETKGYLAKLRYLQDHNVPS